MYKLIKPLQQSGKMEVTPEQSEALQKELFNIGYEWADGQEIRPADIIFWYSETKEITWSFITDRGYFGKHKNPLHTFTDHFEPLDQKQP